MLDSKLKYRFVLVSQYETRMRIVIDRTIIRLEPNIETETELTKYQKQILDNLLDTTYNNKIAFIICSTCKDGIPSNEQFCIKCGNPREEKIETKEEGN